VNDRGSVTSVTAGHYRRSGILRGRRRAIAGRFRRRPRHRR
jgi:hypothetical protein